MTIGPAPMIRIDEMSVRFGILLDHQLAFPSVEVAIELLCPSLQPLRVLIEDPLVDGGRPLKHQSRFRDGGVNLGALADSRLAQAFEVAVVEVEQGVSWRLSTVFTLRQQAANLGVWTGAGSLLHHAF